MSTVIDSLVSAINNAVKANGNKEITGNILQVVLDNMVGTLTQINGLLNVNQVNSKSDAYGSASAARQAVPNDLKTEGLVIAYKLSSGWVIEQNIDLTAENWTSDASWDNWTDKLTVKSAKNGHIPWISNVAMATNGYINSRPDYPNLKVSPFLRLDNKSDITVKKGWYDNGSQLPIVPLCFYTKDKIFISAYEPEGDTGRYDFTIASTDIPADAEYIRIGTNFATPDNETLVSEGVNLLPVSAAKTIETPITQGVGVDVFGRESLTIKGYVNGVNGTMESSANIVRTPLIPIKGCESVTMALYGNIVSANNNGYAFFDADKHFISGGVNHDSFPYKKLTITPPSNAEYLAICYPSATYPYIDMSLNDIPFYVFVNYRVVELNGFSAGNFDQTGSFESATSQRRRTSLIPISEGELLEYHSVSLDSVVAAIFDGSNNVLCKSERGIGGQATIVHGTLVAPQGAAYACVYSLGTNHAYYPTDGFLPTMCIIRRGYKANVFDDAFDARISDMRKGAPSEAQEQKIKDVVFSKDGDFVLDSSNDYSPTPVATISSDDALEGYIQHTPGSVISQGGFFSRMFPLCETVGRIPHCEAVEYQRIVNDINTETLNNAGIALKVLCAARGWEAMNHTMTARFTAAYAFDTWADAMAAVAAHTINPVGTAGLTENSTTHIYIRDRKVNYFYTKAAGTYSTNEADWLPVPYQYIKPKLWSTNGTYITLNPTYPYEYQINTAKKKISRVLETDVETFVAASDSNSYKMREFALLTHKQTPASVDGPSDDFTYNYGLVKMPLLTHIARIGKLDLAESSTDNVAGNSVYNAWKLMFDNLIGLGSKALIYGCHIYRHCWVNRIPDDADVPTAAKVDTVSGGTYPESWILPVRKPQDFPNDFLLPHPDTNLSKWGTFTMQSDGSIKDEDGVTVMDGYGNFVQYSQTCWMPCYGTRLFQLWRFLLYIQSQGVPFLTFKDNIARLYNRLTIGFYPYPYNNTNFKVQDEPADSSYYLVGADGSKLYHKA